MQVGAPRTITRFGAGRRQPTKTKGDRLSTVALATLTCPRQQTVFVVRA
jgi:hypothetical protein